MPAPADGPAIEKSLIYKATGEIVWGDAGHRAKGSLPICWRHAYRLALWQPLQYAAMRPDFEKGQEDMVR